MIRLKLQLAGTDSSAKLLADIEKQVNVVNDELRKLRYMVEELPPVSIQLCESEDKTPPAN